MRRYAARRWRHHLGLESIRTGRRMLSAPAPAGTRAQQLRRVERLLSFCDPLEQHSVKQLLLDQAPSEIAQKHRAPSFGFALPVVVRASGNEGETEMTSKTVCGNAVTNFLSATRRSRVAVAALAGVAMLASSIQGINAAQTTQVREVDDPGRIAYESEQHLGAEQLTVFFPVVPAGHRLVIQHVSGTVTFQSAVSEVNALVISPEGFSAFQPPFTKNITQFDQLVQLYVDAGNTPQVTVAAADALAAFGELALTGYLLDCTAAPCARIAH